MKSKYQVYKDVGGQFRFRLRAMNNKIVAVSQAYESKTGCINGIKSVRKNCQSSIEDKTIEGERIPNPKYEIFADASVHFRFNLVAANGEIILSSQGYTSKQGGKIGIEAVKKSCDIDIEDLTAQQKLETVIQSVEEQCVGIDETGILLLEPPNVVDSGSLVTFEGWLINAKTGRGIANAPIDIWENDRSFMSDKVLVSGVTDNEGAFNISWKAVQKDWWDDSVELYAKFSGSGNCKAVRSANYRIEVLWYAKPKT